MRLGTRSVALVTILALHSGTSVQATPNLTGYPNSMAATGDSITRAYNTGTVPFSDGPGNSWSTGTRTSVGSHYGRILTAEPAILGPGVDHHPGRTIADHLSNGDMAHLNLLIHHRDRS